ncbi:MAG: N-acetylglucosamine-6-phosphate deacetylase [Planctomycetes bacterium]|nr:N-acetylglucosamine-6-phosphate deacetylase [Planctomycetota bacterium]
MTIAFQNGAIILEDRVLDNGRVEIDGDTIRSVGPASGRADIDLQGGYLCPGFVELHAHGGSGHDFMDGDEAGFRTICQTHARHGTTSICPTTTVARHEKHMRFFELCRKLKREGTGGARVLGAHFYGPYFAAAAKGAHPSTGLRPPDPREYEQYLGFADCIATATIAPELPGAEGFVRACRAKGIVCTTGHSLATFAQMTDAVRWGVRHLDHLFCAHSDYRRLREFQTYPMRGGILEAAFYFDELSTEVIADGKHLDRELLMLAFKLKGPDRLALVTDCSRALDMPDGEYLIGPRDEGTPFLKKDGVGVMLDGKALASSVVGMDHCVKTFHEFTGQPLHMAVRLASLTPAKILGLDKEIGSIAAGKRADLVVLDRDLRVRDVYLAGQKIVEH